MMIRHAMTPYEKTFYDAGFAAGYIYGEKVGAVRGACIALIAFVGGIAAAGCVYIWYFHG